MIKKYIDPNLEKIANNHLDAVKRGDRRQAITDGADYLSKISGCKPQNYTKELDEYISYLYTLKS